QPPVPAPGEPPYGELPGTGRKPVQMTPGDVHRDGIALLRNDLGNAEPMKGVAPQRPYHTSDDERADGEDPHGPPERHRPRRRSECRGLEQLVHEGEGERHI